MKKLNNLKKRIENKVNRTIADINDASVIDYLRWGLSAAIGIRVGSEIERAVNGPLKEPAAFTGAAATGIISNKVLKKAQDFIMPLVSSNLIDTKEEPQTEEPKEEPQTEEPKEEPQTEEPKEEPQTEEPKEFNSSLKEGLAAIK